MNYIWDTTQHYSNYPEEIKKKYSKIYFKYLSRFTFWIDNISKDNKFNLSWWLSTSASRDERESNIYHYICIYLTLLNIKKINISVIIVNSFALKKILIRDLKKSFVIKVKNDFFYKEKLFFKNFISYLLKFFLIKIIYFKKIYQSNLILIGTYIINKKSYNFYGNFYNKKIKNLFFIPFFTNVSLLNFILNILNSRINRNFLLKENYLKFSDLFRAFFFNANINLIKKKNLFINKINFNDIILEEIKFNRYARSVLQAFLNYFFIRRLKKNNFKIIKFINSFENQIPDKGWNLGINRYYPKVLNIGHQSVSYHPQFQNLYPTNFEYLSNLLPSDIFVSGNFFIKERNKFCKKIKFFLAKDFKFKKIKKIKKDIEVLILMSGIKCHDIQLMDIIIRNYNYFKKKNIFVYFKFHPILESNFVLKKISNFNFFKEIKGNGSYIIQRSKIVITSSFTAGLYESLIRNCYTLLYNMHPIDFRIYQKFNYLNNLFFFNNLESMVKILNITINKPMHTNHKNYLRLNDLKNSFFNN